VSTDPEDKSTNCICFDLKLGESDFLPLSSRDLTNLFPEEVEEVAQ